jgi:hypothetical protein
MVCARNHGVFVATRKLHWAYAREAVRVFRDSGKPEQNGYIETSRIPASATSLLFPD